MKISCLIFITIVFVSTAQSQSMIIHLKHGRTVSYDLSEIEKITYSSDRLSGVWSGTLSTNDPSVGRWADHTLTVDFDKLTATSSSCGYEKNIGTVKVRSASTIEVSWPGCGLETVAYSFEDGILKASGHERAYSGGRTIPTRWELHRR